MKCSLYFKSMKRIKNHKLGLLGERCFADGYTGDIKESTTVKSEKKETIDNKSESDPDEDKNDEFMDLDDVKDVKVKIEKVNDELTKDGKVKLEKVKGEKVTDDEVKERILSHTETVGYKPAPVVDLSDDEDEFYPDSDDSAPSDDDVETHLGLCRKIPRADRPKKRKRKAGMPENAKVVYMTLANGQKVKKFTKTSTKFVPSRPWNPYPTQVTVEQVCTFLEMKDYPIPVTKELKESFKDVKVFEEFAIPLFRRVNPKAHPLVLQTLLRSKWFEVMNTLEDDESGNKNNAENGETLGDKDNTENDEKMDTSDEAVITRIETDKIIKPKIKRIKLNWTL